jgi:hypothetical protein
VSIGSTFVGNFSNGAEKYILGSSNPVLVSKQLDGDGIVPYRSQDMSYVPRSGNMFFYDFNRGTRTYQKNVVHIGEPKEVQDLNSALDRAQRARALEEVPTLFDHL